MEHRKDVEEKPFVFFLKGKKLDTHFVHNVDSGSAALLCNLLGTFNQVDLLFKLA